MVVKCVESFERGIEVPDRYFIIDNGGKLDFQHPKVEVKRFGRNLGVASSWNWFIQNVPDVRFICNDDIEVCENTVKSFKDKITESQDEHFFVPQSKLGEIFSHYVLLNSGVDLVGLFDEKFYPAYFEDNDMHRRMNLVGVNTIPVPDCTISHKKSSTLAAYTDVEKSAHHENFRLNKQYYTKKWGGTPGKESYSIPFNG